MVESTIHELSGVTLLCSDFQSPTEIRTHYAEEPHTFYTCIHYTYTYVGDTVVDRATYVHGKQRCT